MLHWRRMWPQSRCSQVSCFAVAFALVSVVVTPYLEEYRVDVKLIQYNSVVIESRERFDRC